MTSRESAIVLAKALDSKKGMEIKVLKTEELTTLADYFVICTASSTTQIKALSDVCEEAMERNGERVHHIEGHRGGTWVLMDFSSVVVHIFMDEARKFYDLERLWGDAQEEDLSQVAGGACPCCSIFARTLRRNKRQLKNRQRGRCACAPASSE